MSKPERVDDGVPRAPGKPDNGKPEIEMDSPTPKLPGRPDVDEDDDGKPDQARGDRKKPEKTRTTVVEVHVGGEPEARVVKMGGVSFKVIG